MGSYFKIWHYLLQLRLHHEKTTICRLDCLSREEVNMSCILSPEDAAVAMLEVLVRRDHPV